MAFSPDDKQYLELLISPIRNDIISIKEYQAKANGKLLRHDELINEVLIERATNREHQKEIEKEVICNKLSQKKLEEELMEYRFFKKYPKSMLYLTATVVIMVLYQIAEALKLF